MARRVVAGKPSGTSNDLVVHLTQVELEGLPQIYQLMSRIFREVNLGNNEERLWSGTDPTALSRLACLRFLRHAFLTSSVPNSIGRWMQGMPLRGEPRLLG
jgi:hypothetical protein